MDDDFDPKDKDLEDTEEEDLDDFDEEILLSGKKGGKKGALEDDPFVSLDELADEEDGPLAEDSFDDDEKDLW
jgi:hypothetical protein